MSELLCIQRRHTRTTRVAISTITNTTSGRGIEDSPREIPLSSKIIRRGCLVSQPAAKPFFPGRHEIINSKGTFKTIGGYCSMWYSMRTHLIYGYVRPLKRS